MASARVPYRRSSSSVISVGMGGRSSATPTCTSHSRGDGCGLRRVSARQQSAWKGARGQSRRPGGASCPGQVEGQGRQKGREWAADQLVIAHALREGQKG